MAGIILRETANVNARSRWFQEIFGFEESCGNMDAYLATKSKFTLENDGDEIILRSTERDGKEFPVGKFFTPTLDELRQRGAVAIAARPTGAVGGISVEHLAVGDALELHAANPGGVFLAASQFNCLEFPTRYAFPEQGVSGYSYDMTQGPACALACAGGTVYRNYFAKVPVGEGMQEGQTREAQLNTLSKLEELVSASPSPKTVGGAGTEQEEEEKEKEPFWVIDSGYSRTTLKGMDRLASRLAEFAPEDMEAMLMGSVAVGVQENVGVTFADRQFQPLLGGRNGIRVTQVYASALCLQDADEEVRRASAVLGKLVLHAAYEAALWAGMLFGKAPDNHTQETTSTPAEPPKVFVTLLGEGVFKNDPLWIADALGRAVVRLGGQGVRVKVVVCHHKKIDSGFKTALAAAMKRYF